MPFPTNCLPRVITLEPSHGCSLTRSTILGMTPQMFENLGFQEIGMERLIQQAREARAVGVVENTLETLLFSRIAGIKDALTKQSIGPNQSVILPYFYRRQKRNIQSNYWNVTGSVQTPGFGTGNIAASSVDFTITNSVSPYASALVDLGRYFLVGKYLMIETVNPVTKVAYSLMYQITNSVSSGDLKSATVSAVPNLSSAGWAALAAGDQATYRPTVGQAFLLQNSVSDYEQWCNQDPAENPNTLITYWLQTSRETHKYTDEYLKALNAALMSGYFKDFRELPLAEQKKIQHGKWQRDLFNSVFYGQAINENQTVETYRNLPPVVDPNSDNCTLQFKSNALGLMPQLQACGKVYDHQGNALSLDLITQACYDLKRAREATGESVEHIEFGTDRFTAGAIMGVMINYYKAKYGMDTMRFYQPGQELKFENQVMLKYNTYQLPPDLGGVDMTIWTHPYFDDKLSAMPTSIRARGRTMWGIDWGDFTWGIAATNSASRQTNIYDNLYNCVIEPNITHYQLNSTTWSVIIEDPTRHQIVTNFSDAVPVLTMPGANLG